VMAWTAARTADTTPPRAAPAPRATRARRHISGGQPASVADGGWPVRSGWCRDGLVCRLTGRVGCSGSAPERDRVRAYGVSLVHYLSSCAHRSADRAVGACGRGRDTAGSLAGCVTGDLLLRVIDHITRQPAAQHPHISHKSPQMRGIFGRRRSAPRGWRCWRTEAGVSSGSPSASGRSSSLCGPGLRSRRTRRRSGGCGPRPTRSCPSATRRSSP
jgi:hypothetical protein